MLFYYFSAKVKVAQLYLPVVARCKFYFILKNNQFTRKYNFSSPTRPSANRKIRHLSKRTNFFSSNFDQLFAQNDTNFYIVVDYQFIFLCTFIVTSALRLLAQRGLRTLRVRTRAFALGWGKVSTILQIHAFVSFYTETTYQ